MKDFLYGVLFAASVVGIFAGVGVWLLDRKRKPAFSTGLVSTMTLALILLGIACRNARPSDYLLWSLITLGLFILWGLCVAFFLHLQHSHHAHSEK